jgi:uncharacterized protein (DUF1810 family)
MTVNNGVVTVPYNGVKVFAATKYAERESLGDRITDWTRALQKDGGKVVSTVVCQSSDSEFHCLSITLFYEAPRRA